MIASTIDADATRRIVIWPNRSLTWRQTKLVYICVAGFSLAIGGAFALVGFWPVLPFAGGEVVALGLAFYLNALDGMSREVISVRADTVEVEKSMPRPARVWSFKRAWAQVTIKQSRSQRPNRLVIRSHGNEVMLGEFLTETERERLATTLEHAIRDEVPRAPRGIQEAERVEDA